MEIFGVFWRSDRGSDDRIRRRYVGQDVQTEREFQGLNMFNVGGSSGDDGKIRHWFCRGVIRAQGVSIQEERLSWHVQYDGCAYGRYAARTV